MPKQRKVVYVEVKDRNPFGEEVDEEVFQDPEYTSNYIPGWSKQRHDNELRKAAGEDIIPLRERFQWARCKGIMNTERDEGRRVQHWRQKRYEIPDYDDVVAMGYDLNENSAIHRGEDGKAYWGEHILMMASAKVAAAHLRKKQQADEDQQEQSGFVDDMRGHVPTGREPDMESASDSIQRR